MVAREGYKLWNAQHPFNQGHPDVASCWRPGAGETKKFNSVVVRRLHFFCWEFFSTFFFFFSFFFVSFQFILFGFYLIIAYSFSSMFLAWLPYYGCGIFSIIKWWLINVHWIDYFLCTYTGCSPSGPSFCTSA